ncbi:MAG: metallophosphoesterase [Planctomycetaceae bacterium]
MDWWNLLGMIVLVAGHTELLVTLVNRTHCFPVSHRILRHFRHADDLLLPIFPLGFFWFQGIHGAALLYGGAWRDLPLRWQVYLGFCVLGCLGLLHATIRWQRRRDPDQLLRQESQVIDIGQNCSQRPVAAGPYRFLTHVPGNEFLQLDICEKHVELPGLPAQWDGLTVTHFSDLHFVGTVDLSFFEAVMQRAAEWDSQLVLFTGDLMDSQACTSWLPKTLGQLRAEWGCHFILGNHDAQWDCVAIRQAMTDLGWSDLSSRVVRQEHDQHVLALGGTEAPWMGGHPDFSDVTDSDFRILLSHTPDHFPWAIEQNVDLVLAGHNHGGQVVLPVIGPVYSPSWYGVRYSAGLFWQNPCLLHVTRGVSGLHPLRWRCRPELVKLVLRSPHVA